MFGVLAPNVCWYPPQHPLSSLKENEDKKHVSDVDPLREPSLKVSSSEPRSACQSAQKVNDSFIATPQGGTFVPMAAVSQQMVRFGLSGECQAVFSPADLRRVGAQGGGRDEGASVRFLETAGASLCLQHRAWSGTDFAASTFTVFFFFVVIFWVVCVCVFFNHPDYLHSELATAHFAHPPYAVEADWCHIQ